MIRDDDREEVVRERLKSLRPPDRAGAGVFREVRDSLSGMWMAADGSLRRRLPKRIREMLEDRGNEARRSYGMIVRKNMAELEKMRRSGLAGLEDSGGASQKHGGRRRYRPTIWKWRPRR